MFPIQCIQSSVAETQLQSLTEVLVFYAFRECAELAIRRILQTPYQVLSSVGLYIIVLFRQLRACSRTCFTNNSDLIDSCIKI